MSREKVLRVAKNKLPLLKKRKTQIFPNKYDKQIYSEIDVRKSTFSEFMNGGAIGETNFYYICTCFQFSPEEIESLIDHEDEKILPGEKTLTKLLPASKENVPTSIVLRDKHGTAIEQYKSPSEFSSYIEEKTERFTGRKHILEKIRTFIFAKQCGYFVVVGEPGQGKTAILARFTQLAEGNINCISYFFINRQGIDSVNDCLTTICSEMKRSYELSSDIPSTFENGRALNKILEELSKKIEKVGKKLVIVIDALDEISEENKLNIREKNLKNILFLPPTLPKNIYFLLSRRPYKDVEERLSVDSPKEKEIYDLREHQYEGESDIKLYIWNHLNDDLKPVGLTQWFKIQPGLTEENFVKVLAEKSDRNFMYVRCVLQDISEGSYNDLKLNDLPQGLDGYYLLHWKRMGLADSPRPMDKLEIVYTLARLRDFFPALVIADMTSHNLDRVKDVLDEWYQFLKWQTKILTHNGEELTINECCIYHKSYSDFLEKKAAEIAGFNKDTQIKILEYYNRMIEM